jgi:hypothetical protein
MDCQPTVYKWIIIQDNGINSSSSSSDNSESEGSLGVEVLLEDT